MKAVDKIELVLDRDFDSGISCIGALYVDGKQLCYIIEDSTKNGFGKGCGIPCGMYRVVWSRSPRLGVMTLRLLDVPGRAGILIHKANSASQLLGCLAPGKTRAKDWVGDSKRALEELESALVPRLLLKAECWITVNPVKTKNWK